MPEVHDEQIVIDADEEAYLRGAFRRFALPYFGGFLVLVVGLWFFGSKENPQAPLTGETGNASSAATEALTAQVAALQAELEEVRELAREADAAARSRPQTAPAPATPAPTTVNMAFDTSPEWKALVARLNAMTTRVKNIEVRPTERVVTHTGSSNADTLSAPLLERMYNIEMRQEKEEQAVRETQKSLLDRIYALESRADTAIAERTALDQSTLSRMKNLEDRFFAVEQQVSESTPAARR